MRYLAILGRQPEISIAELEAFYGLGWQQLSSSGCVASARRPEVVRWASPRHETQAFRLLGSYGGRHGRGALILGLPASGGPSKDNCLPPDIKRFGGVLKMAVELVEKPLDYLQGMPEGKVTIGVSDYSKGATKRSAQGEALKLKKILVRHGRSVRVVENKEAVLSTATSLHNGLSGKNPRKVELIKTDEGWFRVIGVQDIDAYSRRDQARPARDAKVGMLPPKLAQILINLCGPLESGATVLDPFCGTGVVLQEAVLMGYRAYGTDVSERMVKYSEKNLKWLVKDRNSHFEGVRSLARRGVAREPRGDGSERRAPRNELFYLSQGDAISYKWQQPVAAVACEGYLGKPFSKIPTEMELKEQKQECAGIVLGFLKNLVGQVKAGTPVVIAVPAWLREDDHYERMDLLDEIEGMGYNVNNKSREGLLYHREEQVVARDIIILRKK